MITKPNFEILEILKNIKLLILDVDGIFTKGSLYYSAKEEHIKRFSVYDGLGIKNLLKSDIKIAIISSRDSEIVSKRCLDLGIDSNLIYQGCHNKNEYYQKIKKQTGIMDQNIAFMGDDLPDLAVMKQVKAPISVPNAIEHIKSIAICSIALGTDIVAFTCT